MDLLNIFFKGLIEADSFLICIHFHPTAMQQKWNYEATVIVLMN